MSERRHASARLRGFARWAHPLQNGATVRLAGVVIVFFTACHQPNGPAAPNDWKTVDAGKLSFEAPPDIVEQEVQGIDSYVRAYASPTMRVSFDYGSYSDPLTQQRDTREYWIHGRLARVFSETTVSDAPTGTFPNLACAHFPRFDGEAKLTLCASSAGSASDPLTVIESIR